MLAGKHSLKGQSSSEHLCVLISFGSPEVQAADLLLCQVWPSHRRLEMPLLVTTASHLPARCWRFLLWAVQTPPPPYFIFLIKLNHRQPFPPGCELLHVEWAAGDDVESLRCLVTDKSCTKDHLPRRTLIGSCSATCSHTDGVLETKAHTDTHWAAVVEFLLNEWNVYRDEASQEQIQLLTDKHPDVFSSLYIRWDMFWEMRPGKPPPPKINQESNQTHAGPHHTWSTPETPSSSLCEGLFCSTKTAGLNQFQSKMT